MTGRIIISKLLEYSRLDPKAFSGKIGLSRAQAIYDIQNGKTKTISPNMADKIISVFPEINRGWLLTSVGDMLVKEPEEQNPARYTPHRIRYWVDIDATAGGVQLFDDSTLVIIYRIEKRKKSQIMAIEEQPRGTTTATQRQPKTSGESIKESMQQTSPAPKTIKLSYSGSGVKFLRILGWLIIAVALIVIIYMAGSGAFDSGIAFLPIIMYGSIVILFAGICFALATIAENALISTAILKEKYKIEE